MKIEEKSNIISEEEFLTSLGLGDSNPVTASPKQEEVIIINRDPLEELVNPTVEPDPIVEKQEEEVVEEKPTEEEIEVQEQKTLKRFGVKETINTLIESDVWSDIAVKIGDKEYDSIESLLQHEKPTKELFESLAEVQKTLREEKINEDYISIKGRDETRVKLINAILTGVEYEDLLKYNTEIIEPVKTFDFANQDIKATEIFVRQCLKDIENIPEKYIEAEIQELIKDFKLIEKAEEFQAQVIQDYNAEIELRLQTQYTIKANEEAERSSNIKDFKKVLKEKDFSDSFIHKAVQLRYSTENDGKPHYEKLLEEKLKDKDFASQFIHFLLDKEDFLKKEKAPIKEETAKKMMELVNVIPKEKGGKTSKEAPQNLTTADEEFLDILNIRNNR